MSSDAFFWTDIKFFFSVRFFREKEFVLEPTPEENLYRNTLR